MLQLFFTISPLCLYCILIHLQRFNGNKSHCFKIYGLCCFQKAWLIGVAQLSLSPTVHTKTNLLSCRQLFQFKYMV